MNNYDLMYDKLNSLKPNECILLLLNKYDTFSVNHDKFRDMLFSFCELRDDGLIVAYNLASPEVKISFLSSLIVETDVAQKRLETFKIEYLFRKDYLKKLKTIFNENLFEDINKLLEYLYARDLHLEDVGVNCDKKYIFIDAQIKMTKNPIISINISDVQNSKIKDSFIILDNKSADFIHVLNKGIQLRVQHFKETIFAFRKLNIQ